ncbi:hypothetical protein LINPERHAP1_LOCUS3212 [Linum perenne]
MVNKSSNSDMFSTTEMQDKADNHPNTKLSPYLYHSLPSPLRQWRFHFLAALAFVSMVVIWSIDSCTIRNSIVAWSFKKQHYYLTMTNLAPEIPTLEYAKWATAELEPNFTSVLLSRWQDPSCSDEQTTEIVIPDMDEKLGVLELTAGDTHRFVFQAVSESNKPRCSGGDYFESDLSGEAWKSRPQIKDFGNGSYSITFQVHPDFAGDNYNLTLFLLFRRSLESNGWVYSTHCSFKLFQANSAWNCLKNRWIFFSGDSNHVDSIRNLLNFVLGLPDVKSVPRRFDLNFTNPNDASQSIRITSIFNGHWNDTQNGMGLDSFRNEGFRNLVKKYFTEEGTVPDTIIMNSGLHDGVHSRNIAQFISGVDVAAEFWNEVMDSVRRRGLVAPRMFYRTTVAPGGTARVSQLNPSKMEVFNWMVLEKFRRLGLLSGVIDNFDMTFPWHFNNRCSDGQHYGRPPTKILWKDGEIGHQYFVDLMLIHVLLNVLCVEHN